ncbi:MAG: nucleotidyl transferase AbiEii/AbiGii toxin family protein [Nitriliruptor sp.]|uniref:nucleotidyl transferase AbiEii/AbiGii toxin family protein n=1 Tax=Nitriliruptor sp. TaxID=2448056 RepID=UPI0034A00037
MTRSELAADIYRALQRHGRTHGRPTDELLHLYALEGFLARLATHEHRDRLILKGGMLLAAFDTRRPTRDVDLPAQQLDNDPEHLRELVAAIAAIVMARDRPSEVGRVASAPTPRRCLPANFADVLDHVTWFADPIIDNGSPSGTWRADSGEWR